MKFKVTILALIVAVICSGCSTVSQRQAKVVSSAVYATQDALAAGRVDLAKQYNAQAVRLLVPPAKRQAVATVESKGQRFVVLPVEFTGRPALTVGSPALVTLTNEDKALQRQFNAEKAALAQTEKAADTVIADKERIVEKSEAASIVARSTFWGRVAFWGKWALVVAALVALCYFVPVVLPILIAISRVIGAVINKIFTK